MYIMNRISIKYYSWALNSFRFYWLFDGFMIHIFKYSIIVTKYRNKNWAN